MKNIILNNISKIKTSTEDIQEVVSDKEIEGDLKEVSNETEDYVKTNEAIIEIQKDLNLNEKVLDKVSEGEEVILDDGKETDNVSVVAESLYKKNMRKISKLSGLLSQNSIEDLYSLYNKKHFSYSKENFSRTPRMVYNVSKEDIVDIISNIKESLRDMFKDLKTKYLELLLKIKTKSIKESFGGPEFDIVINKLIENGSVIKNRNFINEGIISKVAYDVETVVEFFKDFSIFDKRAIKRILDEVQNKSIEPEVAVNKIIYGEYSKFKILSDRSKVFYKDKLNILPENNARDFILLSIEDSNRGTAFFISPDFREAGFVKVKLSPIFSFSKEIDNGIGDNLLKRMKFITEKGSEIKTTMTAYVDACIDTIKTSYEPKDPTIEEQEVVLSYNKQLKNVIDAIVKINFMSNEFKKINEDIIKNFE